MEDAIAELSELVREAFEEVEGGKPSPEAKVQLVDSLMELGRAKAQAKDFAGAEETLRQAAERAHTCFGKGSERVERAQELLVELMELQGLSRDQAAERAARAKGEEKGGWGASWGIPSQWSWN